MRSAAGQAVGDSQTAGSSLQTAVAEAHGSGTRRSSTQCFERGVDHTLARAAVHLTDHLADHPPPLLGELAGIRQRALDARDHLLEALRRVERAGGDQLAVVLADHVLRRPRLARWRTLVVEHADGGTVVDERIEQDRARVADDDVAVLEERRELLEVVVARLLHVHALPAPGSREPLAPLLVARMWPEEELETIASGALPPADESLHEAILVGRVRRRVPHDERERAVGIEPVAEEKVFVLLAPARAPEDIRLGPTRHADALRRDAVVAPQVFLHDTVLDDVEVAVRRDDALSDGVVPARDVCDDRQPEPARGGEVGHRVPRLDVREDEGGAVLPHRLEEPPRDMPAAREVPALHRRLEGAPARESAFAVGVEHPVRMLRLHPLEVEAVAMVESDRERVIAELAVEGGVHAGGHPLGK